MILKIHCTGRYLTSIPKNCLFDKGKTGCGGTTCALINNENYIVCTPYLNAIKEKIRASKEDTDLYPYELLGIYSGISESEVLDYLTRNQGKPIKIITTYESLTKLIEKEWIEPNNYNLLIDEFHCLIREYVFRNEGVSNVLTWFKSFASYTFMSATPVFEDDYVLDELKNIPIVKAIWDTEEKYSISLNHCNGGLITPIVNLINRYLNNEIEGNLYLFVNSLRVMTTIIYHPDIIMELSANNTKLIASTNSVRQLPFYGGPLNEGGSKKINMLTSTAFEAVDIHDELGRAVIMADTRLEHTLFDTSTTLIQVIGRFRNSKFKNEIEIFVKGRSKEIAVSYEKYRQLLAIENERVKKSLLALKGLPEKEVEKTLKSTFYDLGFIKFEDKQAIFDNNHFKYQLWKYRVSNWIFGSNGNLEASIHGNLKFSVTHKKIIKVKEKASKSSFGQFKFCAEKLVELSSKSSFLTVRGYGANYRGLNDEETMFIEKAIQRFPYIIPAINQIGIGTLRKMGFNTSNIKRRLTTKSDLTNQEKIRTLLDLRKLTGKFLSNKEIKNILSTVYHQAGVSKTPIANDISKYYNVQKKKKNGKCGYLIAEIGKLK